MTRALALLATAVLGLVTQASAGTLSVYTTDLSNNVTSTFGYGETFLLKVTGDTQGGTDNAIQGTLFWNSAIATTLVDPPGCNGSFLFPCSTMAQGDWLPDKGSMFPSAGSVFAFNQAALPAQPANNQVATSVITLVTGNVAGVTTVTWGGSLLDFFGIYVYEGGEPISVSTGFSFGIIPEPATAALIGLGLLGLALRRRRRA